MQNKRVFIVIAVFLMTALAWLFVWRGSQWLESFHEAQKREAFVPPGVPKRIATNFSRDFAVLEAATEPKYLPDDAFTDLTGKSLKFSDFAGKPALINFWATWCAPCVVELPSLEKLQKHYEGQMNVIAVALEQGRQPSDIKAFLDQRQLGDFAGYLDEKGALFTNLGIRGVPTSFLIGSDGLILYRFEGDADWASPDSQAFFDVFLLQKR